MRRTIGLAFVGLILLSNCSRKHIPPKDSLVTAIASVPTTLDPRIATGAIEQRLAGLIFNSLVKIGPSLKVEGDAAESWKIDGNDFEFVLKPNIMFTNGRKVLAEDLNFSLQEYQKADSPFQSSFSEIKALSITEKNEQMILRFKMAKYSAKMLTSDWPTFKILPKQELLADPEGFKSKPFGTGSFKIKSISATSVVLDRFEQHPYARPLIRQLEFKVVRDDFTRFMKMFKGELDFVQADLPLNKISSFESNSKEFEVLKYPGLSFSYILVNHKHELLKNKLVRKALSLAIDRESIIKYKLEGFAQPAVSILTPENPFFNKNLQSFGFSPKEASELLKGQIGQNKNLTLYTSNSESAVAIGKVLSHQLSQLGLMVSLKSAEWGSFYDNIKKGQFELASMRWVGALDPDIYRMALHSKEIPPGRNRGTYINGALDKLLEAGLSEKNMNRRVEIYNKVQKIVTEDMAIIPLWYNQQVVVINKRVKNYRPALNGNFSPLIRAYK